MTLTRATADRDADRTPPAIVPHAMTGVRGRGLRRGHRVALAALAGTLAAPLGGCIIVKDCSDDSSDWSYRDPDPWIGVETDTPGPATSAQLGLDRGRSTLITHVRGGRPADRAGLERYDVVVAINGSNEADPSDLRRAIRRTEPGTPLTLTVVRGGEQMDVIVEPERR